jgi:multidrug efflux pump subunit AcrB
MSELQKKIVTPVPLSQVTNGIDLSWENGVIQRKNGQRSIQAQCEPAPDVSPEEARLSIKDAIEEIELPIGYKMEWMGEYDMQQRALINVFNLLPLAGVLIIFILVMLFNDYKKPLIILLCLPIVFIGIVPVLILSKQPFSFTAIVGTIGMAGMLIKNSIVLLEEIEHLINSKIDPYTAVVEATISRTRPVMMASITTILGVIPLITDPMYGPLAVTIMSGLLVGTLITLVLVPIFYARFYNIKKQVTKL